MILIENLSKNLTREDREKIRNDQIELENHQSLEQGKKKKQKEKNY